MDSRHGLCLFGSENNDYSVSLTIKQTSSHLGPLSWKGIEGDNIVACSGVKFTLMKNANNIHGNKGTSLITGQFPEILFSVLP